MTEQSSFDDDTVLLKILVASEHARADAMFRKDRRAFESFLAPDYYEVNLFGRFSREEILMRVLPLLTLQAFSIDEPRVRRTEKDSAEITYNCTEDATLGRNNKHGTFPVNARYTRIGNLWKISRWEIVSGSEI